MVLRVTFRTGISDDRASAIEFLLSDNERGRANLTADFKFFEDYVAKYREQGGAAPKL